MIGWKNEIMFLIEDKTKYLKQKEKPKETKPILQGDNGMKYLKKIQIRFVMVAIGKAANDIAIICNCYYLEAILKEVGIIGEENKTYTKSKLMKCEIINEKVKYSKKLGFKVSNKEKDLPLMYCIPKMYKTSCGTRFIIASKLCSSKQLPKPISSL